MNHFEKIFPLPRVRFTKELSMFASALSCFYLFTFKFLIKGKINPKLMLVLAMTCGSNLLFFPGISTHLNDTFFLFYFLKELLTILFFFL